MSGSLNIKAIINEITKSTSLQNLREITEDLYLKDYFLSFTYVLFRLPNRGLKYPNVITHYPVEWIQHYMRLQYFKCDPVLEHAMKTMRPFMWSELFFNNLTEDQHRMFEDSRFFSGIESGITVPLYGPQSEFGIVTTALKKTHKINENTLLKLSAFAMAYHEKAKQLILFSDNHKNHKTSLSKRELECLLWTANGKTYWEISQILSLSEETIRFYMKNSFRKLNVNTKTQAIMKCVIEGLIIPGDICEVIPMLI
jgi:DNA-binding CsgD family transcriptional regulator